MSLSYKHYLFVYVFITLMLLPECNGSETADTAILLHTVDIFSPHFQFDFKYGLYLMYVYKILIEKFCFRSRFQNIYLLFWCSEVSLTMLW